MENRRISLDRVSEVTDENPDCGLNSDSSSSARSKNESSLPGVLQWVKSVAVDPGNSEECSRKAGFNSRKHLYAANNKEFLKKKRKHDLLQQETSKATSKLHTPKSKQKSSIESSIQQCSFATSDPSLISNTDSEESSVLILPNQINSVSQPEFSDNISRKGIPKGPSSQASAMDRSNPLDKEPLIIIDSDDSDSDSNPLISKKEASQTPDKSVEGAHFPMKKILNLPTVRPDLSGTSSPSIKRASTLLYSEDSVSSSNLTGSTKPQKHQAPQKSIKQLNLIGEEYQRLAIPVGPRFQAEIPECTGPPKMNNLLDVDDNMGNTKWLGTKIWPIEGINMDINTEMTRKKLHNSCSCDSPGSTDCVKHHIAEERLRLQSELGPAFYNWKFNEMGEEVSNSWTQEEQKNFEYLMRKNPMSNTKVFWKTAFKSFPCKHRENIISYFFNVHVLRRISRQTRLGLTIVDTDDDDEADGSAQKSKNSGIRYLTQLR